MARRGTADGAEPVDEAGQLTGTLRRAPHEPAPVVTRAVPITAADVIGDAACDVVASD